MIEHYKRLVSLVLGMHAEQATENGTYDPQGDELEAILLAHQIRDIETRQNSLNQKESASDAKILSEDEKLLVSHALWMARATEFGISKLTDDEMFGEIASEAEDKYLALDSAIKKLRKNKIII